MKGFWPRWPRPKRKLTFRTRVFSYLAALLAVLALVLSLVFVQVQRRQLAEHALEQGAAVARLLADGARLGVFSESRATLSDLLQAALRQRDVIETAAFNGEGKLLLLHAKGRASQVAVPAAVAEAARRSPLPIQLDLDDRFVLWAPVLTSSGFESEEDLYFRIPGQSLPQNEVIGFVSVTVSKESLRRSTRAVLSRSLLISFLFLGLGAGVTYLVVREASRPLARLVEEVREHGADAEPGAADEIGALSDTFGRLVAKLDASFQRIAELKEGLERAVEQRTADLRAEVEERKRAQTEVQRARDELEERVQERTVELERTHRQLLHAEKLSAVGRLAASLAHEFNNPIFAIRSVLDACKKNGCAGAEDADLIDLAIDECNRVAKLVRDLQSFNRPTTGVPVPVDLHGILDAILLLCRKELSTKKAQVEKRYAPDLPRVRVVEDQAKQVFLNLVTNAVDALPPEGGEIRIRTEVRGSEVAVRLEDSGAGIPPEIRSRIFEPFFTTKPAVKGTGLGLAICHGIVERHGGSIEVESHVGRGSAFTVFLPAEGTES